MDDCIVRLIHTRMNGKYILRSGYWVNVTYTCIWKASLTIIEPITHIRFAAFKQTNLANIRFMLSPFNAVGREATEGLRFLASLPRVGAGREKTQPFNWIYSRPFKCSQVPSLIIMHKSLLHSVFPLILGGKVALNCGSGLRRFNATFPPDIKVTRGEFSRWPAVSEHFNPKW